MADLTEVIQAVGRGEPPAARLLPMVYDELRRLAAARLARERPDHTLQPTALVHEAWLRLNPAAGAGGANAQWDGAAHFFGAAAEAMRRILIESARARAAQKRGGDRARVELADADLAAPQDDDRLLALDEALRRLEAIDPQKAQVVQLRFFGGLTNAQVAAVAGVTERTVERHWAYAKAWLHRAMTDRQAE